MKQTEKGIIISRAPYSETSLIVTVLTEALGLNTYLFQGAKKKKGMILFPLALVEFSYYKRLDSALGKISELHLAVQLHDLPANPIKASIAFFIVELIQKTIQAGHQERALFHFIWEEAQWLNHSNELTNYAIWFLASYSRYAGITPSVEAKQPTVFDLVGGKLSTVRPIHVRYLEAPWLHWFEDMLEDEKNKFLSLNIPKEERKLCLDAWLNYYQHHLTGMRELKSLEIIRAVLND